MNQSNGKVRSCAGGAVVVAAALAMSVSGTALAAKRGPTEAANVKVVKAFIASWNDPDKAVTYLSDKASVRMVEDQPAVVGPQAVDAAFKGFMSHGEKLSVKILSTSAKGPVVMDSRVDTMTTPGKPDQAFPVIGVFVVKDGKITEWTDYLNK
jgi:limonene-1,2-epoxide hydrolase